MKHNVKTSNLGNPTHILREVMWSDEDKIKLSGQYATWQNTNTTPHPEHTLNTRKHGAGSCCGTETLKLVRVHSNMEPNLGKPFKGCRKLETKTMRQYSLFAKMIFNIFSF